MKKFIVTFFSGTIVYFILAMWLYGVRFRDHILENLGSATNIVKDPVDIGFVLASNVALCLMLTLFFINHLKVTTAKNGLIHGMWIGFLVGCFMDFSFYGTTNVMNLHATMLDLFILTFLAAATGATMGFVSSKMK